MTDPIPSTGHTSTAPRLRWHVAALAVALVAVWPLLDLDGAFTSDEGSYITQARAIEHGDWDVGYAFEQADPTGLHVPFHGTIRTTEGTFVFAKHPSWPFLLAGSTGLVGETVGLRLPGVVALLALAAVGWGIGGILGGPRAAPWAFWMTAASPALASAWVTWAHVPAAVGGGLAVLGLLRASSRPQWLLVAAAGSAMAVLLRTESVLWVVAVAVAWVIGTRTWRAVVEAGVVAGAGAVAFFVDRGSASSIVGDSLAGSSGTVGEELARRDAGAGTFDRLAGLRLATLDGAFSSSTGKLLAVGGAVAVLAAVVLLWRRASGSAPAILLTVAAALFAARILAEPKEPIPGLVLAAPVLLLALLWRPRRDQWWLVGAVLLFVTMIGAATYADGGSLQWGGRFFAGALAPLAAMAAAGVARFDGPSVGRRPSPLATGVILLLAVQAIGAIVVPDQMRRATERNVDAVVATGSDVLVANGGQIPRLDLEGWPDRCWLAVEAGTGADGLRSAFEVLAASGASQVTYVGFTRGEVERAGLTVDRELDGLAAGVVTVGPRDGGLEVSPPYTCDGSP